MSRPKVVFKYRSAGSTTYLGLHQQAEVQPYPRISAGKVRLAASIKAAIEGM